VRLRPYQRDACLAVARNLREHDSTLVVHATGTGKTVTMAFAGEMHRRSAGGRVMVLEPRDELIEQARRTLLRALPLRSIDVGIEAAESRAPSGTPWVIASPQSLHSERLAVFTEREVSLLIADEAHLSATPSWLSIFQHFPGARRVGFTATPDRLDGRPLVPSLYASVAHVYELPDAIADGFLSPLTFQRVLTAQFDEGAVRRSDLRADGRCDPEVEREALREEVLTRTAAAVLQFDGKTLAFCVSVEHAHRLAELLSEDAAALDGSAPKGERRAVMDRYRAGKIRVLCNCLLYTYGLDIPDLANVVIARPTMSRALYSQMVGRVTRLFPGKEFGRVIDLVGIVGQHALVTPSDALSERDLDLASLAPREAEGALLERSAEEELDVDTLGLLERESVAAREVKLEAIDPELAMFGIDVPERVAGERNATWAQAEGLRRWGIERPELLSFEQAQAAFEALAARAREGICTLRQGRQLARRGLNPNAPREDAEWAIGRIAAAGWRRTPPEVVRRRSLRYGGAATLTVKEV